MLTNFHTKYKVECKIGEGSFSEVLKCQERPTGKLVAAKQLKKHFKSINHASEIPELMVLRKMSKHPNLLELYESYYDTSNGKVTLVFELMDMSLYDLMKTRKRPIPESRAKKYLYQIIKGIDHLHYHGIFHRDIKPENVLIKGDQVKISDMGSIKGFYSKQPYTEYISTRWYRSPECLLTKGFYGPKMDIWAIGCVYYELLTLKPLFPGSDELDQITKINHVLGSPSAKLMNKLKKVKCRNVVPAFPHKKGTGLNSVIPMMTEEGREIFKQMIVYDPDSRINVRRLLEYKYFNDIRHEEMLSQRLLSTQSMPAANCRLTTSPMWLSFITATRKRRIKRKISVKSTIEKKHSVQKTQTNMTRVSTVVSSEVSFSNNSDDAEGPTSQVYSMKPSIIKEESDEEYSEAEEKFYDIQPDRIPGCEQFTKRKLLQSIGSKALAGLGLLRQKEIKNINSPTQSVISKAYKYSSIDKQISNINSKRRTFKSLDREMGHESVLHQKKHIEPTLNENDNIMLGDQNVLNNQIYNQLELNRRIFSDRFVNSYNADSKSTKAGSSIIDGPLIIEKSACVPSANQYDSHMLKETNLNKQIPTNMNCEVDMLPSTADMRDHISPKNFNKRKSYLSRFSEDEAVNLAKISEGRTCSVNSRQENRLKRYHSGQSKKVSQSSYYGPFRKTMSTVKVQCSKDINGIGVRTTSTTGFRSTSTTPGLNMKSKQGDVLLLQRRLENMAMKGAQDSLCRFRTKQ